MTLKTIMLALIAAANVALPIAVAAMPPANAWEIGPLVRGRNYSIGMPANPTPTRDGGLTFEFPQGARGEIDALTTAVGPLSGAGQIHSPISHRRRPGHPLRPLGNPRPNGHRLALLPAARRQLERSRSLRVLSLVFARTGGDPPD